MLERRPLGGARDARESLEPAVDLQRISRDGDRIVAGCAQSPRERNRHGGLADARRAEHRDHAGSTGWLASGGTHPPAYPPAIAVSLGPGPSTPPPTPLAAP